VSVARKIRFCSSDGTPKDASVAYDALLLKVVARYDGKVTLAGDYKGRILLWEAKPSATEQAVGGPAFRSVSLYS